MSPTRQYAIFSLDHSVAGKNSVFMIPEVSPLLGLDCLKIGLVVYLSLAPKLMNLLKTIDNISISISCVWAVFFLLAELGLVGCMSDPNSQIPIFGSIPVFLTKLSSMP